MRLAVVTSHPIQYQAPLFRELVHHCDIHVFFAHRASARDQAEAGFGVGFEWDVDLLSGYAHTFVPNVARQPNLNGFAGCDTPSIASELARGDFDALLLMGWRLKSDWQAILAAKRLRVPVLVRGDSHLLTQRSLAKRLIKGVVYPVALRTFDAALYVGEESRLYWQHYGYPSQRMFFSPHCVDNDWFAARATSAAGAAFRAAHGIPAAAKVALFAGKLSPGKRPLDMVSAASVLRRGGSEITILIAGSGLLERELVEFATLTGVPLVSLGFCNQSVMPSVFAAANLIVLPSEGETWGLVANEALACGKPIVVSDACGCAADLAADHTAGTVYGCGDIEGLAAAMRELISNPPSADLISLKSARYSPRAAADGIINAVQTLLYSRRHDVTND